MPRSDNEAAIADNPFLKGEAMPAKAYRELLWHLQLSRAPRKITFGLPRLASEVSDSK
jgi:hypothetical protein